MTTAPIFGKTTNIGNDKVSLPINNIDNQPVFGCSDKNTISSFASLNNNKKSVFENNSIFGKTNNTDNKTFQSISNQNNQSIFNNSNNIYANSMFGIPDVNTQRHLYIMKMTFELKMSN